VTQIIVDDILRSKLNGLTQPLELCNDEGKVIARVTPIPETTPDPRLESPHSREEIQRRKQDKGKTYTTAEVLAILEKL
jgi:hypothetical protein